MSLMKIKKNQPPGVRNIWLALLLVLFGASAEVKAEIRSGGKKKIYVIPVSGNVDPGMAAFIKRSLEEINSKNADLTVVEMDTFGGRVDSALQIVDSLSNIPSNPTISFVTQRAISAGALIALAANDLMMKHHTTIGDCAPIMMSSEGPKMMGEKFQSPLRAKFRALARKNGYPERLAEAMVSMDKEVYEVTFQDRRLFMTANEFSDMSSAEREAVISKKTIVPKGELLTMDDTEAVRYGFSKTSADNLEDALAKIGYADYELIRMRETWSEAFVRQVGSMASILMLVGLGALYLEYKSPGFGIPGIVGLVCLGLVFFNQYLVGLADYTELFILIIGILLLAVELFVLPGFGLAGMSGLLLIGVGLILAMQDFVLPDPSMPWETEILMKNLARVIGSFVFALISTLLTFRYVLPRFSRVVEGPYLEGTLKESHISLAGENGLKVGDGGVSDTFLRPSGKIRIGHAIYDAVSSGDFIEKGVPIRITRMEGNRIIVSRTE